MVKSLLEIIKQLLGLAKDTQENKDAIKSVQTRLETLTDTVERVIFELQRLKENEAHEREKMALRLENTLLRSERALPSGGANDSARLVELERQITALHQEIDDLKRRVVELER